MKKMYISWETPPKDDEKFSLYTKNNRMIVCENRQWLQDNWDSVLSEDEILGWLPVLTGNKVPAFMPNVPPVQMLESKN